MLRRTQIFLRVGAIFVSLSIAFASWIPSQADNHPIGSENLSTNYRSARIYDFRRWPVLKMEYNPPNRYKNTIGPQGRWLRLCKVNTDGIVVTGEVMHAYLAKIGPANAVAAFPWYKDVPAVAAPNVKPTNSKRIVQKELYIIRGSDWRKLKQMSGDRFGDSTS